MSDEQSADREGMLDPVDGQAALGERIADLEAMLDRVDGQPDLQRRLHGRIAQLRAAQRLERERHHWSEQER